MSLPEPNPNPYAFVPAATAHEESQPASGMTLHPLHGAVIACFLGSPIGAAVVFALNYFRLGKRTAAWATIAAGFLITVALLAVCLSLPDDIANNRLTGVGIVGAQMGAAFAIGKWLQGPALEEHEARGGKIASAWYDAGIGLLALIPALILMFGMVVVANPTILTGYGTQIAFGKDEVFIAGDATPEDAERVASVLKEHGYFTDRGISVRLEIKNGRAELSLVFNEEYWHDEGAKQDLRVLGQALLELGYEGPVTVHMCDDTFVPKTSVTAP